MFTILISSADDLLQALFVLSYYQVKFQTFSDAENPFSTEIVVDEEMREGDLRLAEMAFQMNYRQVGHICPSCQRDYPEEKSCGHLTFKGQIGDFPNLSDFSFLPEPEKEETTSADFQVEQLDSFPPKSNPMHHDTFNMGVPVSGRIFAMHDGHNWVNLIDMRRGTRIRVTFPG